MSKHYKYSYTSGFQKTDRKFKRLVIMTTYEPYVRGIRSSLLKKVISVTYSTFFPHISLIFFINSPASSDLSKIKSAVVFTSLESDDALIVVPAPIMICNILPILCE